MCYPTKLRIKSLLYAVFSSLIFHSMRLICSLIVLVVIITYFCRSSFWLQRALETLKRCVRLLLPEFEFLETVLTVLMTWQRSSKLTNWRVTRQCAWLQVCSTWLFCERWVRTGISSTTKMQQRIICQKKQELSSAIPQDKTRWSSFFSFVGQGLKPSFAYEIRVL